MGLLKWKEMAEKKSELGEKINAVKGTIKQKYIRFNRGSSSRKTFQTYNIWVKGSYNTKNTNKKITN